MAGNKFPFSSTQQQQDIDSVGICHGSFRTKHAKPQNSSFIGSLAPKGPVPGLPVRGSLFSEQPFFFLGCCQETARKTALLRAMSYCIYPWLPRILSLVGVNSAHFYTENKNRADICPGDKTSQKVRAPLCLNRCEFHSGKSHTSHQKDLWS